MSSLYFQICSMFYIVLLMVIYFSKERLASTENKLYAIMIVTTFIGLILDLSSTYIAIVDVNNMFLKFLCKAFLQFLVTWTFLFVGYISIVSLSTFRVKDDEESIAESRKLKNKVLIALSIVYVIVTIVIYALRIDNFSEKDIVYTYGPSVEFLYIVLALGLLFMIGCVLINYKNIRNKKYTPVLLFLGIGSTALIIQNVYPELLLVAPVLAFITFLMYFTIENPDLQMIAALALAKEDAERANSAKSDFLSNMSHEIRTPLNAIVGFSQSLMESGIPDDSKDEVEDIMMASSNLLDIVNGILDISKIEANKLEIVDTEYSFKTVFNEVSMLAKGRLGEKPLELRFSYDESIPSVLYGDYVRIKQILINILTNSIKYTKKGHVDFKVSSVISGDVCRLIMSIEDSGIGIETEKIESMFNKFERADLQKNISIEGTGLGLAITKRLIELMHGKLIVQSLYGKGTKFTVSIDQKVVLNPTKVVNLVEKASNDSDFIDVSGRKVLVVDDNKINLKVAARLLQTYKVDILTVESGQECLDLINKGEKFDIIFLDDMMPNMSGVETLQILRKNPDFVIPTVALTANAISGMREKYLSDGFNDYVSKPIAREELDRIIKLFLTK